MTLTELPLGKVGFVDGIALGSYGQGLVTRLEAMGIVPDKPIQLLRKASLGGPLHVRVGSTTEVAIRRSEAQLVLVNLGASDRK